MHVLPEVNFNSVMSQIQIFLTPVSLIKYRVLLQSQVIDMVEKVQRVIALTIESSSKEERLTADSRRNIDQERGTEFCSELLSALQTCFSPVHRCCVELAKDKALQRFHAVRLSQLPGLWTALLADMSLNSISPLLLQSVNRKLFEGLMVEYFANAVGTSRSIVVPAAPALNSEEENALRYCQQVHC